MITIPVHIELSVSFKGQEEPVAPLSLVQKALRASPVRIMEPKSRASVASEPPKEKRTNAPRLPLEEIRKIVDEFNKAPNKRAYTIEKAKEIGRSEPSLRHSLYTKWPEMLARK